MSTAYAISEGYWSTTDDHGAHSLRIGAALYCFDHEGFVDELRSPGSDTE
jgi:hypothetical protein